MNRHFWNAGNHLIYCGINTLQTVEHCPRHWQRPGGDCETPTGAPCMPPDGKAQSPSHREGPRAGCAAWRGLLQIRQLTRVVWIDPLSRVFSWLNMSVCLLAWTWLLPDQPKYGQSWSESPQSGKTLQQAQTKLFVTSTNKGGKALFYWLSF